MSHPCVLNEFLPNVHHRPARQECIQFTLQRFVPTSWNLKKIIFKRYVSHFELVPTVNQQVNLRPGSARFVWPGSASGQDSTRSALFCRFVRHPSVLRSSCYCCWKPTRKPRVLVRVLGLLLPRLAERRFVPSLFQEPPRLTRFEPDAIVLRPKYINC